MDGKLEYRPELLSSAKEKLQRSLQLKPDFHQALSTLAHIHYLLHEYDEALARYEELIKVRKAGSYLEDMAEICALRGDFARAVELLKEAIGMNPSIYRIGKLAGLLAKMGDMQGAKREIEKLKLQAEKYVGNSGYWRFFLPTLAQAYSVTGDLTEAERALREAIRLAEEQLEQRTEYQAFYAKSIAKLYSELSGVLSKASKGEV